MKIDLTKMGDAPAFFQNVDGIARELLGRSYKKYLRKSDLTKQAESKIKACLTRKHVELFGTEFLQRWVRTYFYYYLADVYEARFSADKDSWNSDIYSNAFFGLIFKQYS